MKGTEISEKEFTGLQQNSVFISDLNDGELNDCADVRSLILN